MWKIQRPISLSEAYREANITDRFSDDDLKSIGARVWDGFKKDKDSRQKWEKRTQAAMDLAMQIQKSKSFPWPGSANVAFPLVTIACLQWHSRAYPALVGGPDIVHYRVTTPDETGEEAKRAERVGRHMSWQVMEEDQAWEEGHDRMFLNVPIVGCAFQKSYHDPAQGGNVSELVLAQDLVMDYYAKSVESCRRKTQICTTYRNDLYSGIEEGRFRDVREESWYQQSAQPLQLEPGQGRADNRRGQLPPAAPDEDTPYTTLEQHCWMDFDGDGYAEPWIITIESRTHCVLRIVARWDSSEQVVHNIDHKIVRIRPTEYYTKYGFIPSPDGGVYDVGFGVLLGPLNSATNSIMNQLLDAGTLSTTAGGFLARGAKIRGGQYQFTPFGWNRVDATGDDLKKSIFPMPTNAPSPVLLQLLQLLIEYTGRVAGVTDTMVGENPGQNTPAQTTQTMVEQGMKIYSAIFKRMWRSMKEEFQKLYLLNSVYMPDVTNYGIEGASALREDYRGNAKNIAPVADPNVSSDSQLLQRAITIKQSAATTPGYDLEAVERNFLRALKVDGAATLYPGPKKVPPLPNPKAAVETLKAQGRMQELQAKIQADMQKYMLQLKEEQRVNTAKIAELEAQAANLMGEANGKEVGQQIEALNAVIGAMRSHNDALRGHAELMLKAMEFDRDTAQTGLGRGVGGMEGSPGNSDGTAVVGNAGAGASGGMA